MCMNKSISKSQGVTLIELVISIVIIAISVMGVTSLFVTTTMSSADPMIRAQQLAIAQSYMDEIFMQAYEISGDAATTNRADYNELDDYDTGGVFLAVQDQYGHAVVSLNSYRIAVTISNCAACGAEFNTVSAKKITVEVKHNNADSLPVIAYRTDY